MKKHQFYSMAIKGGVPVAEPRKGYTDGEYNYYNAGYKHWHCIEPTTGLSVVTGTSKEHAQQRAAGLKDQVEKYKASVRYKADVDRLIEKRSEHKTAEVDTITQV